MGYLIWFSPYLFWFYVSNIYHKQTAHFHYCHSYTGARIKWTFIWYFRISINRTTNFVKLDMSTARRRLKSSQSLSGTSTHPIMVTHRSLSWSWMIDSHPFRSMSFSTSSPQIRLFQTLTLKLQVQGHECCPRPKPYSQPIILHTNQITILEIQLFWNLTLKNQSQGYGWGQRSGSYYSPSIQLMHLLFVSYQSDQPFLRYVQKSVRHWKHTSEIFKANFQNKT